MENLKKTSEVQKIDKVIIPNSAACMAQQVYILGTFNPGGTPLLLSQTSACFIQEPPEGMVVGIMKPEQPKTAENIMREQAFSLNYCNIAMRKLSDAAWYERIPAANDDVRLSVLTTR